MQCAVQCLAAMLCLHSQLIAQNLLELPHLVASVLISYRIKSGKSKIKGISTQMKDVIKTGVQISAHFVVLRYAALRGAWCCICNIGPVKYKQLLSSFGISNGFERTWIWAVVMLILLLSTHFIKAELLSK